MFSTSAIKGQELKAGLLEEGHGVTKTKITPEAKKANFLGTSISSMVSSFLKKTPQQDDEAKSYTLMK